MREQETRKKMRELAIFRNKIVINKRENLTTVLHQDDMINYNTWFLIEHHGVDKVIYRGSPDKSPIDITDELIKLGNPKNVIITQSTQDTY